MKKLVASALLLSACTQMHGAGPVQGRIVTEDQFRATVVGRPVRLADGVVFTINADNTLTGDVNGQAATGTWAFEDGFWCRRIVVGDAFTEDCQLWVVDGDRLIITRDRGRGERFAWRLAG